MEPSTLDGGIEFNFDDDLPGEKAGEEIGRYRLVRELGSGGFGTVWLADQVEPVRRSVALKILKLGMDTRQVVARFEQERQALALMDHPHVARVLDAGSTSTGRPYFVMDLVQGEPIAAYCDRGRLTIEARLVLFEQVCAAVQHAHGKGIIHRDLKPSNILVGEHDGTPHATVIDFGIAKATAGKLTEMTLATQERQLVGTLAYMSPEQAAGSLDLDTRTDVYSLGVVLYELLTGGAPFDARAMPHEQQRMVLEVDPEPPSSKIGLSLDTLPELAERRGVEPRRLGKLVSGELDWIVLKALEKDRARRYQTAQEFAADIRRFLTGEPVFAAPPSRAYRFRKFVRKNRLLVAAASIAAFALVSGAAAAVWGKLAADEQRMIAQATAANELVERRQAEAVAALLESLLEGINPTAENDGGVPLKDQLLDRLDRATRDLETFAGDSAAKARLQSALARTLMGLAEYTKAVPLFEAAHAARRAGLGPYHPLTRRTALDLAASYQQSGRQSDAMRLVDDARVRGPEESPAAQEELDDYDDMTAMIHQAAGRHAEAVRLLEAVRGRQAAQGGPDTEDRLLVLHNLGVAYRDAGRRRESADVLEDVQKRREALLGPEHVDTLMTLNSLAVAYSESGRHEDAVRAGEESVRRHSRRFGPDYLATLSAQVNLSSSLSKLGRHDEALAAIKGAKERAIAKYGVDFPYVGTIGMQYARGLADAGRFDAALEEIEPLVLRTAATFGPESKRFGGALDIFVDAAVRVDGQKALPARLARLAEDAAERTGPESLTTLRIRSKLGISYRNAGNPSRGLEVLNDVLAAQTRLLGEGHADTLETHYYVGCCRFTKKEFPAAIDIFEKVLPLHRVAEGEHAPGTLSVQDSLAASYWSMNRFDRSVPLYEDSLRKRIDEGGASYRQAYATVENLAVNYLSAKTPEKAAALMREWQPRVRADRGDENPLTARLASLWFMACKDSGRNAEAVAPLESMRLTVEKSSGPNDERRRAFLAELADAYSAAGRFDRSVPLREDLLARTRESVGNDAEETVECERRLVEDRRAAATRPSAPESAPTSR